MLKIDKCKLIQRNDLLVFIYCLNINWNSNNNDKTLIRAAAKMHLHLISDVCDFNLNGLYWNY